ncbi:MAG: hypothetical protein IPK19_31825 [Chloroflexi bacterium]|nr:hypothetical protein [Chloroflexota bacterium]
MSENTTDPELLAKRLDQVLPPNSSKTPPETPDSLVNAAAAIARLPVSPLSLEAIARMEMRMLVAFEAEYGQRRGRHVTVPAGTWRLMQTGLAASVALLLLFQGVAPSVDASTPGNPLYPIKRQIEQLELTVTELTGNASARSALLIDLAERRAEESLVLIDQGQLDVSLVESAASSLLAVDDAAISESPRLRLLHAQAVFSLNAVIDEARAETLASPELLAGLTTRLEEAARIDVTEPVGPPPGPVDGTALPIPADPGASAVGTETASPEETAAAPDPGTDSPDNATDAATPQGAGDEITATAPGAGARSGTETPSPPPLPTPTPTLRPSNTPRPTNTRRPSHTPRPTHTPRPSNAPRQDPTARPTNTEAPTSEPNPGQIIQTSGPPGQGGGNPGGGNPGGGNPGGSNP